MSTIRPESAPRPPLTPVQWQAGTLDAILAASPDLVYLCGRAGKFLFANGSGAAVWGLNRSDIIGRTWDDLGVPPEVAASFDAQRNKVLETGQPLSANVLLPTCSGQRLYEYTLTPIRDGAVDVAAVVFTLRDFTEQRRAEDALRDSEEKHRLLAENSTDMISRHDPAGVYLYASPACKRLLGYEPGELVGRSAYDLIDDRDRADVNRVHGALLRTSETFTVTFRIHRKDDSVIWFETTTRTVRNPSSGEVVEIQCSSRDVSQRKEAEEALRQSEERFRAAFDAAAVGIAMATPEGRWLRVNPALCEIVGYTEAELLSMTFQEITHPDDLSAGRRHFEALLAGQIDAYQMEKRYLHKRGHLIWVHVSVSAVRGPDGQPLYEVGLIEDITRRRKAEERLREQNSRLEVLIESERQAHQALKLAESQLVQAEKLTALGQLVAGVAHEINNPLAFVNNNIAVLRRDTALLRELMTLYQQGDAALAVSAPELLEQIRILGERIDVNYTLESLDRLTSRSSEGLQRIRQIVGDLRDFARLDENDVSEMDLNDGIRATVNIVSGRAHDQGVDLVLDLSPLPRFAGSPGKLNQVVLNLLANAIDASAGGGTVQIRTRPDLAGQGVAVDIIDNGRGIDPTIRDRIFDPFFTTKPVGQGSGLGLSISYGIVRDHGGTIRMESSPGQGARFTIFLPLSGPAPAEPEEDEPG